MRQTYRLERLLEDLQSASSEVVVVASKGLLELGECGQPAGIYLLTGGKAALGAGRLADAVVLLYHGLRVAEPNTKVWADLLVNRASACARHGFYRDAITAGEQFLDAFQDLPPETSIYIPYAHHAMGFAYDKLKEHAKAATHFRLAVETYQDPDERGIAGCDLACALTMGGQVEEAEQVLAQVPDSQNSFASFVHSCTASLVHYHQRRFAEAVAAAERAEALAIGNEDAWITPLSEVQYWLSRAVWEMGDRYRAAAVALRVAVVADQHWDLDLRDRASAWLAEMLDKGGIQNA